MGRPTLFPVIYNKDNVAILKYPSLRQLAKSFGLKQPTLFKTIKNNEAIFYKKFSIKNCAPDIHVNVLVDMSLEPTLIEYIQKGKDLPDAILQQVTELKESVLFCSGCKEFHQQSAFFKEKGASLFRTVCTRHRNAKTPATEAPDQKCTKCGLTGVNFEKYRSLCTKCRWLEKVEKNKLISSGEAIALKRHPENCMVLQCNKPFLQDEFGYMKDKALFKNICKECEKKNLDQKLHQIRSRAKKGSIEFVEEDVEDFKEKLVKPCVYCGFLNDLGIPQGLDRIYSRLGYTKQNTNSCCKLCNAMKNTLTVEEFITHINRIVSLLTTKLDDIPQNRNDVSYIVGTTFGTYDGHTTNPKPNRKEKVVSKEIFQQITRQPCAYCKTTSVARGIDRISSKDNYNLHNMVSACDTCNTMKKDNDMYHFILHCQIISLIHPVKCDDGEYTPPLVKIKYLA